MEKLHDCSPYPPGWRFRLSDGDTYRLRRMGRPHVMTRFPVFVRIVVVLVLSCWWPLRGMFLAWKFTRKFGKTAYEETGLGTTRQFFQQWFLAFWYSINPLEYYSLSLYRTENIRRIGAFFYNFEAGRYAGIAPDSRASTIIGDKEAFARFCSEHGLACVPTMGLAGKGEGYNAHDVLRMAGESPLLIKPVDGSRGKGIVAIEKTAEGGFLLCGRCSGSEITLEQELSNKLAGGRFLLQPLLKNHQRLADLGDGGLTSIRIVTMLNQPGGKAEYLMAVLQLPRKESIISNHGVFCAVDAVSGTISEGRVQTPSSPLFLRHPDTGVMLKGRKIPFWVEAKALALRAHTQLGACSSLGWDVAVTAEGPLLLEANSGWGMGMMQRAFQTPLGETGFTNAAIAYLNR